MKKRAAVAAAVVGQGAARGCSKRLSRGQNYRIVIHAYYNVQGDLQLQAGWAVDWMDRENVV